MFGWVGWVGWVGGWVGLVVGWVVDGGFGCLVGLVGGGCALNRRQRTCQ